MTGANSTTRHFPCQQSPLLTRCCKVAWLVRATGLGWVQSDCPARTPLLRLQATQSAGWVALPARPAEIARGTYPNAVARLVPPPCATSATTVLVATTACLAAAPKASYNVRCDPWVGAEPARACGCWSASRKASVSVTCSMDAIQ